MTDTEKDIRPHHFVEFIGQNQLKSNLSIFISATKTRQQVLDHTLLYGPPGLGKTTIAQIIAYELGTAFKCTSGPIFSKPADLAAILTGLKFGDILFIDEIHRMTRAVEEILYSAMEDFKLDVLLGSGPGAKSIRIDIQPFTLVGATTRIGLLTNPLRDRFGIQLRVDFYSITELQNIVIRGSKIMQIDINEDGATEIAKRSRGTPRIALRLLRRIRDFASVNTYQPIDQYAVNDALRKMHIDHIGLDSNDHRYLNFIATHYDGGPVGIETIAAALAEESDTIEEVIEPYLIQTGFVQRTNKGRILTPTALQHLGSSNASKYLFKQLTLENN